MPNGTPVSHDVLVERICCNKVRQQVYASTNSEFSMQLGARADTFLDASDEPTSQSGRTGDGAVTEIPRSKSRNCELRASSSGFHSGVIDLVDLDAFGSKY